MQCNYLHRAMLSKDGKIMTMLRMKNNVSLIDAIATQYQNLCFKFKLYSLEEAYLRILVRLMHFGNAGGKYK